MAFTTKTELQPYLVGLSSREIAEQDRRRNLYEYIRDREERRAIDEEIARRREFNRRCNAACRELSRPKE